MDTIKPMGTGENGHPEILPTKPTKVPDIENVKDRLVQLFFQLVRQGTRRNLASLKKIGHTFGTLLNDASMLSSPTDPGSPGAAAAASASASASASESDTIPIPDTLLPASDGHVNSSGSLVKLLCAMITHTRDCVEGKGERDLAYAMLISGVESEVFDEDSFVSLVDYWVGGTSGYSETPSCEGPPPGSWKDIVNLCNLIREWFAVEKHSLIDHLLLMMIAQLKKDAKQSDISKISLAAKWSPRERSKKNTWMFYRMVCLMYPEIGEPSLKSKVYTIHAKKLRTLVSELNMKIGTIEVKQCAKKWSEIVPSAIPSVALQKQKTALLNLARRGSVKKSDDPRSEDDDRIKCAENLKTFIKELTDPKSKTTKTINAKRTAISDLVGDAFKYAGADSASKKDEMNLLEAQWAEYSKQVKTGLPPMIPMVDVSGSMYGIPLLVAIGLGLQVSQKTHPVFRNRILTFSKSPTWVKLNEDDTFVESVSKLSSADWGMNTDFYKALSMILDTLKANSVPPEEANQLVLAVFSDMQIDMASCRTGGTPQAMHTRIVDMYRECGYEPPHILYWNLRSTSGFPVCTSEKNVTMLSGFSPALLNSLYEKGIEGLSEFTPFKLVAQMLTKKRFGIV